MIEYVENFKIRGYEVDFDNKLYLSSMFDYMQQAAGSHVDSIGFGYKDFIQKGLYWVLSRIKVEIYEYPSYGSQIKVITWSKGINRLFALRDFILEDSNGNIISKGTSAWVIMDLFKRRPTRILNELNEFVKDYHAIKEIPDKISQPSELVNIYTHRVGYSEIDLNKHVNNVNYIRWIQNSCNQEFYNNKRISEIQVNFLCECSFNHDIQLNKLDMSHDESYVEGFNSTINQKAFSSIIKWKDS